MGKPVEKHPCWTCGWLKVAKSGSSMRCVHPEIVQADAYKYGKPFTCRCTPKWCPKDPDKSYLGSKMHVPDAQMREKEKEDRRLRERTSHVNAPERIKSEMENEMNTADVKMDEVIAKLKDASEARRRLGRIIFETDFRNTSTSVIERSEEIANTEEELSAKLMDTLDCYDGIQ